MPTTAPHKRRQRCCMTNFFAETIWLLTRLCGWFIGQLAGKIFCKSWSYVNSLPGSCQLTQ